MQKMFRISRSVPVGLALLLVTGSSPASQVTIQASVADPGWHVTASQPSLLELEWHAPALEADIFQRDGFGYARLTMQNAGMPETWGVPEVPVARTLIRIPAQGAASLVVESWTAMTHDLAALGAARVAPVRRPVAKVPGSSPDDGWIVDEAAYAVRTLPVGTARLTPIGTLRGVDLAMIELFPVCYDPTHASVEAAQSVTIRVTFETPLEQPEARLCRGAVSRHASNLVLNPPIREQVDLPAGYLILTADALYDAVLPLAEWKTRKGFPTTVIKTSQIPGGATASNIKTYIQNAYQTWDPPPEFVLLVGDSNTIPAWIGSGNQNPPTDLNYSCVDGTDWIPDLYLGRFSLRTAGDIQSLVEKTVDYEQAAWGVDSLWTGREYFISSDDWSYHGTTEGTHIYCMAKARAHGVVCDSLWGFYNTGTPITTAVNDGRAMVAYSGHGVESAWQGPTFNGWYVDQLTNLDRYPIVLSFACLTGNFAWPSQEACFMERWIKANNKGAVIAYGSSVSSFWGPDDYLQRRMWDALFDNDYNWMGGFALEGKERLRQAYGTNGSTRGYYEQYNILGDPSLLMHTLAPLPLAAGFPASIPSGTPQTVVVTVTKAGAPCAGALVCLYKAGEVQVAAYADASGETALSIPAATAGALHLTVTAYNGIAFMDSITVGGGGDIEAPTTPSWTSLVPPGTLSWAPATDNIGVTGYRVYRAPVPHFNPAPGLLLSTTTNTSFDVSSSLGDPLINYAFRVTAIDAASNESGASPPVGEHDYQLVNPSASRRATVPNLP